MFVAITPNESIKFSMDILFKKKSEGTLLHYLLLLITYLNALTLLLLITMPGHQKNNQNKNNVALQ